MALCLEKLLEMGSEWKKGDQHRIYFNSLYELAGFECDIYNSGNVSSAKLDGKSISNSLARELVFALNASKVFFDVHTGKFVARMSSTRRFDMAAIGNAIVAEIKRRAEEEAPQQTNIEAGELR